MKSKSEKISDIEKVECQMGMNEQFQPQLWPEAGPDGPFACMSVAVAQGGSDG